MSSFNFDLYIFNQSDSFDCLFVCNFANKKNKTMGLNIKKTIKNHGLEVREVANRMNITPTGLSQHINGNPSVEVLERIAVAIGCDISELFEKPGTPLFTCPNCGVELEIKKK